MVGISAGPRQSSDQGPTWEAWDLGPPHGGSDSGGEGGGKSRNPE